MRNKVTQPDSDFSIASLEPISTNVQRFLRLPDVREATGLSVSTLYEMMRDGTFPRPMNISKRLVVWPERVVAEWQGAQIAKHIKGPR